MSGAQPGNPPLSNGGSTELSGTVALVTGGARNIGRAISLELANAGAAVVVNALSSREAAEETVRLIEANGGRAMVHVADVCSAHAVAAMVDAVVRRFGRLDFLVNNAAIRPNGELGAITPEEWQQVLAICVDGPFLCTQACLAHLKAAPAAAIVNLGGLTGRKGASKRAHVVTAKAALEGMTRALAHDLAGDGITVNCVVPGTIGTQRGLPGAPEHPRGRHATPIVGRLGEPAEVAAMVRMLCGPGARYITGQSIHVNGGGFMP